MFTLEKTGETLPNAVLTPMFDFSYGRMPEV